VSLPNYPLPVFGTPWTVPFEFPTYQLTVASVHALGVPLDAAGRSVAISVFLLSTYLFYRLWRRLGCSEFSSLIFLILCSFSPFAVVWSRATMIDFTSVALSLAFLYICHAAWQIGWTTKRLFLAILLGCAGALTKITTLPIYLLPAVLLGLSSVISPRHIERVPKHVSTRTFRCVQVAAWLLALTMPLAAGALWTYSTDAIKSQAPATLWLTSPKMKDWNFGTLGQRASLENWLIIGRRINELIVPWMWPLCVVAPMNLMRSRADYRLVVAGLAAGSVGAIAVFFNLYIVHDYYLSAIAFPIWLLASKGLEDLIQFLRLTKHWWLCLACVSLFLVYSSSRMPYVMSSYIDWRRHEVYRFSIALQDAVPPDSEIAILGEEWSSQIPYYSERRAIMFNPPMITARQLTSYIATYKLRYLVVKNLSNNDPALVWPTTKKLFGIGSYTLLLIEH
jgi:hypothetical protein